MLASDAGTARPFTIDGPGLRRRPGHRSGDPGRASRCPSPRGATTRWSFSVAGRRRPPGPHQLLVTGGDGQTTVNGLTFHVLGTGYTPTVLEVGPGKTYDPGAAAHNTGGYEHAIQDALDAAAGSAQALVVVYPGPTGTFNPLGGYFENVIMHSPVKLQGVGPGGVWPTRPRSPAPSSTASGSGRTAPATPAGRRPSPACRRDPGARPARPYPRARSSSPSPRARPSTDRLQGRHRRPDWSRTAT